MTKSEAIAILKSKMDGSVDTSYEWAEAVRMAVEALKETHDKRTETHSCDCGRKETHGDVIYRQDAIDVVGKWFETIKLNGDICLDGLRSLPSVQPDVPDTNVGDMISRQEALDALERIFDRCEEIEAHLPEGDSDRVGYKMYPDWLTVWKYLHQVPSAEPESEERPLTEDDYAYCAECDHGEMCRWYPMYGCEFKSRPSAEPERKTGRWVNNLHDIPICDQCGYMTPYDRAIDDYEYGNFCPNCGAKMN